MSNARRLFLVPWLVACASATGILDAQPQRRVLAIANVNVVDVRAGAVLERRTVLISDGRIRSVASDTAVPAAAESIDGTGRFLIPGLWDMHVHLRDARAPDLQFPLFIAHGVTGVRDMDSDCPDRSPEDEVCLPNMLTWRHRVDRGELLGPRLLALSSSIVSPPWDATVTAEDVRAIVQRARARGADLIKISFRLSPAAFAWLMDEANRARIAVGGHIPMRVTVSDASRRGLRSLEHARDLLFDCFPGASEFRRRARSQNPPTDVMRAMVDQHDVAACDGAFRTLVRHRTWYVPTHVTRRMDALAGDAAFRNDARSKYIPRSTWSAWNHDADRMVALDPTPEGRAVMRRFYEKGLAITGRAHAAGVNVALGTDSGDSYVFPGSSVHDELAELVKAGLTPGQALAAATLRAAEFLGLQAVYGSIQAGKRADLVLLEANPLEDIGNTRRIDAVVFGGRVLSRVELQRMLSQVERAVADNR